MTCHAKASGDSNLSLQMNTIFSVSI